MTGRVGTGDENRAEERRSLGAAQPRPALGRRPWLALERRARSLRRFLVAIANRRVPRPRRRAVGALVMVAPGSGWISPPLGLAAGGGERWRGLRGSPGDRGLLLRTRSVHGFGMSAPLEIVTLDGSGRVTGTARLPPRRILTLPAVAWVLELPCGHPVPEQGERLVCRGSLS